MTMGPYRRKRRNGELGKDGWKQGNTQVPPGVKSWRTERREDGVRGKLSLDIGTVVSTEEHPALDHRQQQGPQRE